MQSQAATRSRAFHIADSVKSVVSGSHPLAEAIMDRRVPVTRVLVDEVINQSVFSWVGRNPRPALDENGGFQCTDLDLLSFLVPIAAHGAIIEIPRYRSRRGVVLRGNERKIGTNQFGPVRGLTSNQDVFSFSIRIDDMTIAVEEDGVENLGAPRNYMLVDCDGQWYDGWNTIVFKPDAAENEFLTERGLWTGHTVNFENYVHPNRWQSFWGAPYLLLKMLTLRIDDEANYCRAEVKRLAELGIVLPKKPYTPPVSRGETVPIKVETLEAILDLPEFSGSVDDYGLPKGDTTERARVAYERQKLLTYTLKPKVQFVLRADECAYFRYGKGRKASWAKGTVVESGYRVPLKRTEWNRIQLGEVALRYRIWEKTERVAAR